ncbi:hypothetical protein ACEPPN_014084 [Leptodophora sp. 'Broadleaf-Isolate-01']
MEVILRSCWPGTIYSIPKHVRISNRRSNRNTWPILLYVTENPGEGRGGVETAKQLLLKSLLESSIERAESPAIDGAHDREIFLRTDNEFSVASGHSEVYDAFFRTSVADITDTATAIWVPTTSLVPRHLAHLATWEWITLWLIVLMLLNTLLYNGFIGGATPISDRYTRLFLVSVYILLYLLQSLYSCYTLIGIYECLAQQASWRWIFQADLGKALVDGSSRLTSS